jgi:PAS domain S-box-containing protein
MISPAELATDTSLAEAQALLEGLASVFLCTPASTSDTARRAADAPLPNRDAGYRTLVEQIPAVVFMVYLDRGIGEAYVSPYIEATLGFSQAEWLEDPIRWYSRIHPDDSARWSVEAAEMFLTGKPLRSVYRVMARDGHVVWFHCEAKVVRRESGEPWFIHGVAFDISDLKRTEEALQEERNFVSTVLDTVGTLMIVVDSGGRIVRFNRACEEATGRLLRDVRGAYAGDLFAEDVRAVFASRLGELRGGARPGEFESRFGTTATGLHLISWSGTALRDASGNVRHFIFTGVDITESKRLEKAILEISAREQQRIGQDLHDGLGQHLTGIAFMSKVLEQKLADQSPQEAADAAKIVNLVNEAIYKARELSRGLLPVVSDAGGLMSALEQLAAQVEDLFGISCRFECDQPVLIHDNDDAMHLYHIAQEAVNNAIKHGRARHIVISLVETEDAGVLGIRDDGSGLHEEHGSSSGMGLRIMNYRAKVIGGALDIRRSRAGGVEVICRFRTAIVNTGGSSK